MKIKKIIFNNFKIYKGVNSIILDTTSNKNINLIGGHNGFGKTTFLSGLIWLFYGKMMTQVEEKYRLDVKKAKGYNNYLKTLLNNDIWETPGKKEFSITVELVDIQIPSIPCNSILIKRSYNLMNEEETLDIRIDGQRNELTKQVGYEVFINDFILPREIAKFFFFDAEKIVSLAEAKSKVELRALSKAYSEVLGIKKYEDLKQNLKALLTKLRRDGANEYEKDELNRLLQIETDYFNSLEEFEYLKSSLEDEIKNLQLESDRLQEKLIREGSSVTLEELKNLKKEKSSLEDISVKLKNELKQFYDILPFLICNNLTDQLYHQIQKESESLNSSLIKEKSNQRLKEFSEKFEDRLLKMTFEKETKTLVLQELKALLNTDTDSEIDNTTVLLNFSENSSKEFETLYHYINSSFRYQFEALTQSVKNNKIRLNKIRLKIKEGEARKNNALNVELRKQKVQVDDKIVEYKKRIEEYITQIAEVNLKRSNNLKVLSEYEKNFKFSELAREKFSATENLLSKVNLMIHRIKEEKKFAMQKTILREKTRLFHKKDFISGVDVKIYEDYMDIDLIDSSGEIIDKNELSKGEQQLYATSILKALVDESGIDFPIFIDSPLQKLDPVHAKNVITEFYPMVSDQVVIFPLLEKELNISEYELLLPNLSKTFLIENTDKFGSNLIEYNKNEIFEAFNNN